MCLSALFSGQKNLLTYLRRASSKTEVGMKHRWMDRTSRNVVLVVEKNQSRCAAIFEIFHRNCRDENPSLCSRTKIRSSDDFQC